jgi:hypothetical protein
MRFEWDEAKCLANVKKHNLSFEDAWIVFAGETLTVPDLRFNYGEKRMITFGLLAGRLVAIVYVKRGNKIRIISMRKANERERKIYKKRFGQT